LLSIQECTQILNDHGETYSEEEVRALRDWIQLMATLTIHCMERAEVRRADGQGEQ
jgi:hypothetical protein